MTILQDAPSLPDYWDMLNRHDWTYEYSDDPSVYRRGRAAQQRIEDLTELSQAHLNLFDAFRRYQLSHALRYMKPERPNGEAPKEASNN